MNIQAETFDVVLGFGCDRGTPMATLEQTMLNALQRAGMGIEQVRGAASITLKQDEAGLLSLAEKYGWEMIFYPAEQLATVPVPNPSAVVEKYTGTPSVSEAAALLCANAGESVAGFGHLLVEKHKYQDGDGKNATVSIARYIAAELPSTQVNIEKNERAIT